MRKILPKYMLQGYKFNYSSQLWSKHTNSNFDGRCRRRCECGKFVQYFTIFAPGIFVKCQIFASFSAELDCLAWVKLWKWLSDEGLPNGGEDVEVSAGVGLIAFSSANSFSTRHQTGWIFKIIKTEICPQKMQIVIGFVSGLCSKFWVGGGQES